MFKQQVNFIIDLENELEGQQKWEKLIVTGKWPKSGEKPHGEQAETWGQMIVIITFFNWAFVDQLGRPL